MPDRSKEEFARSAGARELLERLPQLGTKQGVRTYLQNATQYDDVLFSNNTAEMVQKLYDSNLISLKDRRDYASFKANRAVELANDPEKRKFFVDREFRPDLTPEQIAQYREDKKVNLAQQAQVDKQNTSKYLDSLGYTPEDVYRFGSDTSGYINENVPLFGGAELPIMSKSFTGQENLNQFSQAIPVAGGVARGFYSPLGAVQDRMLGDELGSVYNQSVSPLVGAGEAAGMSYGERVASMPGTYIGGDIGFGLGAAAGARAVKGKYRGVATLIGGVLGAAGLGTVGTNINQAINENALSHLIGAAAMAKRKEAQEFNAVNYSHASRIGSLAGDMTFFAPSVKIPGVGIRKAASAFTKQGTKALENKGVHETAHDIADRATEFTQGVFESYQQSEEQKRQGMPGMTPWQILGDGFVGALLSGQTKLGHAMAEPYNNLKRPEVALNALNKLAAKRAEVRADQAVRKQTQLQEQEGTITPPDSRYRRFNLGGRLSGDVNDDGQPIIKGAEYAIYDPEKRKAYIHTDNDFVLEGYRSKNAADSLTSTEFIFKRTPLIEYADKINGTRRSILGISRDAGVVVKDVGKDGQAVISVVPISDIRNEKIATRIQNVMAEHGVKPNDKPAPFMPEAYDNFNKQVFDAEITLDPSMPAFPARVIKQVNQKRQGMYIVSLPDGTHLRVHESQIDINEPGAVVPRGQVQEHELPRSLSDLTPPEKILKNQWKFGQGSENEAVLELTPEQLKVVSQVRRKFAGDLEAIKGIKDKDQRSAAIQLNLARVAKTAESVLQFEGPVPHYKRGDVIDVKTSQFGQQTAIVIGDNKYGHIVRLVDHPRVGAFTVQPSLIVGELSRSQAANIVGEENLSDTQGEFNESDQVNAEPFDESRARGDETIGEPTLNPNHEKVDELELSPYTKGKLAQQLADFFESSDILDDIRDGDFAEESVTPDVSSEQDAVNQRVILLGEKPKDKTGSGDRVGTGVDSGTDTNTDTSTSVTPDLTPGIVIHSTEHEVRRVMRDKPNIEGLNVDFVPIRYEARYSPARGEAIQEFVGKSPIINYNNRKVVLVYINGVQVPFYCSSGLGGKKDVPPGKWYPFFGISNGSWFNKSSGNAITSYYGSQEFAKVAKYLDSTLGDVRSIPDMPKVGLTFNRQIASHVKQINQGLSPTENERPDTDVNLQKNIDETLRRVREAVAKTATISDSTYINPDSIATDDVESISKLTKNNGQLNGFVDGKRALGNHTQLQLPGFKSTGAYLNGKLFTSMGNAQTYTSELYNYSDRVITVVDINGVKIPFYCSTGHNPKDGVIPGQWYPFFGLGENWLNKGSSAAMSEYYGIPSLREVSESLDAKYGDVRKLVGYDAGVDPTDARIHNLVIPNYDGGSWGRRNAKNVVDFTNQSFDKVFDRATEASDNRNWLNERLAPLMSALKGEGVTGTGTDTDTEGDTGTGNQAKIENSVNDIVNDLKQRFGSEKKDDKYNLDNFHIVAYNSLDSEAPKSAYEKAFDYEDGKATGKVPTLQEQINYKSQVITGVLKLFKKIGLGPQQAAYAVHLMHEKLLPYYSQDENALTGSSLNQLSWQGFNNALIKISDGESAKYTRKKLDDAIQSLVKTRKNFSHQQQLTVEQVTPYYVDSFNRSVDVFKSVYPEVNFGDSYTSSASQNGQQESTPIQNAIDAIGVIGKHIGLNATNSNDANVVKIVEGAHKLSLYHQHGGITIGGTTNFNSQVPVIYELLTQYLDVAVGDNTDERERLIDLATNTYRDLYSYRPSIQQTINDRFFRPKKKIDSTGVSDVFMAKRPSFTGRAANRTKDGFIVTVKNTVLNVKINRDETGDVRVRMEMTQYDPKKKSITGQAVTEYTARRQRGGEWHVFNTVHGDKRDPSAFFTVKGSDRDFMRNLVRGMVNHSVGLKNADSNWKTASDIAIAQSPEAQRKVDEISRRKAEAEAKRTETEANKEKQRQVNKEKWQAELALREKLAEQSNEIKREELRIKAKTAETAQEITDLKTKLEKLQTEIGASAKQASDDLASVKDQLSDVTEKLREANQNVKDAKGESEKRQAEAIEKALEAQSKKHNDDIAALQRIVDAVSKADSLAVNQLGAKIETLINKIIEQQQSLAGKSVQLSTDTNDNDARIAALLGQMRQIESQYDTKIDELNKQIESLNEQLKSIGATGEKSKSVKKETVYKENEIDSIVQNREIVTVLKEINGTQYKLDATIVNNRKQLKTILSEQYGYTKTGAHYWSGIVDHFARAWAVRQLALRQRTLDYRNAERTTSEGEVELVMNRVLRQDEETVKSVAMLMREFYRDRFAAFAYVPELSKLDDIGYGATFKAARKDGTSFNIITAFASRDEETGVHEIAHALLRGMDKPYRDKLLGQMQRTRMTAGVFKDGMPVDAEELFVGMFVASLRRQIAPVVQGQYPSGDKRVSSRDLELFWNGTGKYLNEVLSTVTEKNFTDELGNNLTQWVAPFDSSIRLFTGMQVYVRVAGETKDTLAIVSKPDPKDKATYETHRSQYAPEGKVEVKLAGRPDPVLIDRTQITNLGGLTQGFNPGMLETLSKYLGAFYRESDANIWKSIPHLMQDYNDQVIPSSGTNDATGTSQEGQTGQDDQQPNDTGSKNIYVATNETINPKYKYNGNPIVVISTTQSTDVTAVENLFKGTDIQVVTSSELFGTKYQPTDINFHLLTGMPYHQIPNKVFKWVSGYGGLRNMSGHSLLDEMISKKLVKEYGHKNQHFWSSQINSLSDTAKTDLVNSMSNRETSMRDLMSKATRTFGPIDLRSIYTINGNNGIAAKQTYTVEGLLANIAAFVNDGALAHITGVSATGHDFIRNANLDMIGHESLIGSIYSRFGQDGLQHWAEMVEHKPIIDELFKYEPLTKKNIDRLFEYGTVSRRTPLSYALDKAAQYVITPGTSLEKYQLNPGTGFDGAVYLAMNASESSDAVKLLKNMQISDDKRRRINDATWAAMGQALQGFYRNDVDMNYMFNPVGGSVQAGLREYANNVINGSISDQGSFQRMNSRIELALTLDYMSRQVDDASTVRQYRYSERDVQNYREAVSYELKEGLIDLFRHNASESRSFIPVPIEVENGNVIFDRVKGQSGVPLGTFKVNVLNGQTAFRTAGTDEFLPYTVKAKQYNPETVNIKEIMMTGSRLLPKRSWVTAMMLAQLNNKPEIMNDKRIEEIALSGRLPKIVLSESDKKAKSPINTPEVRAELKPIIESMVKAGRIDGDTVRDSRGNTSNVFNLYKSATTMSDGAALLHYARTETKTFKKWSGSNPVTEAIATKDLRPIYSIGDMLPAERANVRKYLAGKSLVEFTTLLNGQLTPEDAVELEVLMDDYLRGESTIPEIREAVDAAIDDPSELQALIDTVAKQLESTKFNTARANMAQADTYANASTRPRTGKPLVTIGFAPNKTLAWLRSAKGFVLSSGPSDQTGYNQYGYYLRVDNPLVMDLKGEGIDAVSVEQIINKNPSRDGLVLLNAKHSIGGLNITHNIVIPRSRHAQLPWTSWNDTAPSTKSYPTQFEYVSRNLSQDEWMNDSMAFMGRMPDINYQPDYTGQAMPAATTTDKNETPIKIRKTRVPDTADKLTSVVDFINDVTRLTLSSDLAFLTLQAGIIAISNPAIGFKAFAMALRGFAPNLRVEWFGGIGHRKLGREVFHDVGDMMRQNPVYDLAREAGLPLQVFEIDQRFAEALDIELHNLRRIDPNATIDDCRTTLMDIDELGTNDEWYIKNRLSRHLPAQGQFERFNSLLHDQVLLLAFDNWHKQFLAMGYVEGSEKMKRALTDGARILSVTTGDVAYSTNKQRDATAGRIAKLLFTAPRWVMSRALIDPWINSVLSGDSFSLLHDLMGHDNPVWNLYKGDQAAAALGRSMYGRLVGGQIFMMLLAILWQNFNPETEVETDITRSAGRVRVGDFRVDPPAGLFDHYRLGYRLVEAALQTTVKDAKLANRKDETILQKIANDLGREVSYKSSPMLNMAVGLFASGKTPIGDPMFGENEASTHVYNKLILPRLIEVNGGIQPWMTDVRVSNAFIERLPTAVSQFVESYYSADKYGANPEVYAGLNTGLNMIGLKTEIKPTAALRERKRKNYSSQDVPSASSVIDKQGLIGLLRGE